jgi:hypothetical protein
MGSILVPYQENGMVLGRGYNSYTQQLGLDQAVIFKGGDEPNDESAADIKLIPQTVSYSSHFVDKLSDVTTALNISASLAIKAGGVSATGAGSFVDENKV